MSRLFSREAGSNVGGDRRQCWSSVSAKSHVEHGGSAFASVFWAAEAIPAFSPPGTVDQLGASSCRCCCPCRVLESR